MAGALMSDEVVLLTGVTGALGSWLAHRALAEGLDVRALARSAAGRSAPERVERALAAISCLPLSGRIKVIEGDILDDRIDPGRIDLVIHCAACTAFHDRSVQDSHQTNVQGLRSILDLARRQQVPLVHVSTAYVCGNRTGSALERELDVGQDFNNTYERTKCEGEALVQEWASQTGLPLTVLRPGIVLGDRSDGLAVRFSTLCHLLRALDTIGPSLGGQRLRLVGRADATKNIIPVDYFADAAWRIIRRGLPGTYHITHPEPITLAELSEILGRLFDVDLQLVSEQEFARERGTPIERMCHHVMAPYRSYMLGEEPRFDRSAAIHALAGDLSAPPRLDFGYFERVLNYGRRVNWGEDVIAAPVRSCETDAVRDYFEVFLAQWTHQNLLPDLKKLSARFSISIADQHDGMWSLEIDEGVLKSISRRGGSSDCSFAMNSATFLEIAAGRVPPQRAFFTGQVRITGNIELGLKVATVLAKFFLEYPFVAEPV
jgi:nucleoside-diphosphate-sugar epimerase/predicted lipid carrier protein YhbT